MSDTFHERLIVALEAAQRWAIHDPDPVTRGRTDALVDQRSADVVQLFEGRIAFGTAGLRAAVGVGPNRMNALVVRQTTAGVVRWLQRTENKAAPRVLIGFDARHDSAHFARHAAAAVVACGGIALLADGFAPTPVYAHALLAERCDAAVVVTASHNPPADNGYKLYLGDGIQIVPPADSEIAAVIDDLAAHWHNHGPSIDDVYVDVDERCVPIAVERWVAAHRASAVATLATTHRDVSIAYTALHGVGGDPVVAALTQAGFSEPVVVQSQFLPDPDFPTAAFPNPEEPGAMDLLLGLAHAEGCDLAVANDPDADRLAIAVPDRSGSAFVALSGNELGVLLADHVLRTTTGDRVVARSVVSSRQLDAMADVAGVQAVVTLTGFKWVARPILTHAPSSFVFGYEEAIGYCVGDRVRDKDGVTAALVAAEMIAGLMAEGSTVWDRLDDLALTHGVYLNKPQTVRFDAEPSRVAQLMDTIAADPPATLGGSPVTASGPVGLGELPPTSGLHLLTVDDTQVIIRPSGTEPKIKAYVEVITRGPDLAASRARAEVVLAAVSADVSTLLHQPLTNNL